MIISDIDVLLSFEADVIAAIEHRHALVDGLARRVLHERPSAQAASIGLLDQQTWLEHARQILPPTAVDEWLAHHGTCNQPVIDLLDNARHAGCRILLMANGTQRLRDDLAHHRLVDLTHAVYLSAETGYAKPDPAAWIHVLRHSRTESSRVITIEPHLAWVHASRSLGIRAHHYTGAEGLRRVLSRARILR